VLACRGSHIMDRGSRHLTILGSLLSLRVCALAAETTPAELPRRLLLVRHGETDFNRAGRIQGTLESQLTDTGRSQAKVLGEYLAEFHAGSIDRVLCSPKARTRATLDEIEAAIDAAGMPRLPEREVRVDLRELELTSCGRLAELEDRTGRLCLRRHGSRTPAARVGAYRERVGASARIVRSWDDNARRGARCFQPRLPRPNLRAADDHLRRLRHAALRLCQLRVCGDRVERCRWHGTAPLAPTPPTHH